MNLRYYSLKEARRTFRRVRPTLERVRDVYRAMHDTRPARSDSDRRVDPRYFDLCLRLHAGIGELSRIGMVIRDLAEGRVDLPSRRGGRPVLLSWRLDERDRLFWRELSEDEAERRPIDPEGPWDASGRRF